MSIFAEKAILGLESAVNHLEAQFRSGKKKLRG